MYILSKKNHLFFLIIPGIFLSILSIAQDKPFQKKVIEFGWDYSDVTRLLNEGDSMQKKLPFNGVTFSINRKIMQAFDTSLLPEQYFKFEDLKKLHWTKFTDNFILLRGFGSYGPNWFDDTVWKNIYSNLSNLSKALNQSRAVGILFDPEYYLNDKPDFDSWIYTRKIYPHKTFAQVQDQVKRRGMQTMQGLQSNKPDIKILAIWMLGLVIDQLKFNSLENTGHALLPSFFAGMLLAKNSEAIIIDGNETAYWYDNASDFLSSKNYLSKGLPLLESTVYQAYKNIPIAQPVFIDGLLGNTKEFNKRAYDTIQKENWLANNLLFAMAASDEYTWIYSQRINWFKESNLVDKLNKAREKVNNRSGISCLKGLFVNDDLVNKKEVTLQNSYTYNVKDQTLSLKFYKTPVCVSVYENGNLIDLYDSVTTKKINVYLKNKYSGSGNLIVLLSYKQNIFTTNTEAAIIY